MRPGGWERYRDCVGTSQTPWTRIYPNAFPQTQAISQTPNPSLLAEPFPLSRAIVRRTSCSPNGWGKQDPSSNVADQPPLLLGQLCPVMGRSSSRATAWTFHSAPAPAPPVQYAQSLQGSNPAALCGAGEGFFPLFPLGPPKSFAGFNTKFHHNFIQQFNNCGTSAISEMDNSSARGGLNRKFIPYLKARIKLSGVKLNCVSIEPGKQRSVGALGHPGCAHPWAAGRLS